MRRTRKALRTAAAAALPLALVGSVLAVPGGASAFVAADGDGSDRLVVENPPPTRAKIPGWVQPQGRAWSGRWLTTATGNTAGTSCRCSSAASRLVRSTWSK